MLIYTYLSKGSQLWMFFATQNKLKHMRKSPQKLRMCVLQSMQEEAKRIEHVKTYIHVYKCEEKNNDTNCTPEKVVETLVKSIGEDKKLLANVCKDLHTCL
jgi:hypothetical protein